MNVRGTHYKVRDNLVVIHAEANTKHATASLLKGGNGAFVLDMEHGIDDNWRYAIVVAVAHTGSPAYIVFQVSTNISSRKINGTTRMRG